MIFTDRTITIRNNKSAINEPVVLYRGDYEVSIRFTIIESKFRFKSGVNLVDTEKASFGQLAILSPYGGNVFSEVVKCEDGTVTFTLTKEMIDQLEEVGLYSFQIRLFDYYRESRVSIPPVEFGIEVREPVASEDHDNEVNNAIVGYSIAKVVEGLNEDVPDTFNDNGQYNKTDWKTGDRISEGKLNKIEDAIDKINQNEINDVTALDRRITNNFNVLNMSKMDINTSILVSQIDKNHGKIDQTYLSDELISQIAGSAAVNAVPADGSITKDKLTADSVYYDKFIGFEIDPNYNLIDANNLNTKGFYRMTDGVWVDSQTYGSTGFIPIDPNRTYYAYTQGHITLWDANFNFVADGQVWDNKLFIPETAVNVVRYFNSAILLSEASDKYLTLNSNTPVQSRYSSSELLINMDNLNTDDIVIGPENVSFINLQPSINLFDKETAAVGYVYDPTTGQKVPSGGYYATNFMPVDYRKEYIGTTAGYITYWDKDKKFLFGHDGTNATRINGDNRVKYCVMTYKSDIVDRWMCVEGTELPLNYIPYEIQVLDDSIFISKTNLDLELSKAVDKIDKIPTLEGLKWNVMGDSISSPAYANDHPYWYYLAKEYNMIVRNYAIGGAWISKGGNQTISEAWETMDDDADMITVFAGTNDELSVNPLGVMSDRTNTTFYGALHVLYNGLINKYPGKKIGIISIMPRYGYYPNDGSEWDQKNKAILEVAAYYNLPVFKAHEELGLSPNIPIYREKYIEDGLHPNEAAHRDIIARRLKSWLESL